MINIVIPMAGLGSRFKKAGFHKPKPFINVKGIPMIVRVIENLKFPESEFFLIAQKQHIESEHLLVKEIENKYNVHFIPIEKQTEGSACTILYCREFINNKNPLLIANADQLVDINISDFIYDCSRKNLDGSILTFIDNERSSKWSYAKVNSSGLVTEVREKEVISEFATVGIYYFSQGALFVNSAIDMIIRNDRVNNEFYTCPVYNYLIMESRRIGTYNIKASQMHGLGTPEDLNKFEISTRIE